MHRHYSVRNRQATYLLENTPLSEREATVLALWKNGNSIEEISEILPMSTDKVERHLSEVRDEWERAQEFCTIMGPHPWGDSPTRDDDDFDDNPWNPLSSAVIHEADEKRSRLELELYFGWRGPMHATYLLVERETVDMTEYATKTTEIRGCHEPNALREYLFEDVETLDEYFVRRMLLEKAGIDPGAKGGTSAESAVGREVPREEAEAARERAAEKVQLHGADG